MLKGAVDEVVAPCSETCGGIHQRLALLFSTYAYTLDCDLKLYVALAIDILHATDRLILH
jgi:hypothetical protein